MFDAAFVLIFSGYLGYDWVQSSAPTKTVDNAIDCLRPIWILSSFS